MAQEGSYIYVSMPIKILLPAKLNLDQMQLEFGLLSDLDSTISFQSKFVSLMPSPGLLLGQSTVPSLCFLETITISAHNFIRKSIRYISLTENLYQIIL